MYQFVGEIMADVLSINKLLGIPFRIRNQQRSVHQNLANIF